MKILTYFMIGLLFTSAISLSNLNAVIPMQNLNPKIIEVAEASPLEPVTTRDACHQDTDFGNGTHVLVTGLKCWVKGSPYTKWVMTSYTDRIEMKNGLYASQLNTSDSTNRYYNLYYDDLKSTEDWLIQYWNGNSWIDSGINSVTPTISTLQNDTGIFVTSTRQNLEIQLIIDYNTYEGMPLEHIISLKNLGSEREFRIIQQQEMVGAYYFDGGFGRTAIQDTVTVSSKSVEFQYGNYSTVIMEMQGSEYYRNATISQKEYGAEASFLFGNTNNQTALTLSQNAVYTLESGATCSQTDQTCSRIGYGARWLMSCSSGGTGCTIDQASSQRSSNTAWDLDDVGIEDGNRAYVWMLKFNLGNVTDGATITNVELGLGSAISMSGGLSDFNFDVHAISNDSCSGITDNANSGFSDNTLGISLLHSPVIKSGLNLAHRSTVQDLDAYADRYVSQRTASSANATDNDIFCAGFSQSGTDVGGSTSDRRQYDMNGANMNMSVTYSTTIDVSVDIRDIGNQNLMEKGNLKLRYEQAGTTTYVTMVAGEKTISVEPSVAVTYAVQWNPSDNTDGYVKIDIGANSSFANTHDETCSSNCDVVIVSTIYRAQTIEFRDENDQLRTPTSFTVVHTTNSTEVTHNSASFASKGVFTYPVLAKGNSSSFTIRDVDIFGKNTVSNSSATITPVNNLDVWEHNNKVYLYDFRFMSNDESIYLKDSDVAFHVKFENGTESTLTDFSAIMISNQSIIPRSIKYQGWSINDNSSSFSLGLKTAGGNTYSATNKTVLITAKYLKMMYQAQSGGANVPAIVNFKSTLANTTVIDVASDSSGLKEIYLGNSSQTFNVFWNSLNVSKSTQAPTASSTVNVATQLRFQTDLFIVGMNNAELDQFTYHSGNTTFRVNATINLADKSNDQTLKIQLLDIQYKSLPSLRTVNTTDSECCTIDELIITDDSLTLSGEGTDATLLKYVLNAEGGLEEGGLGGAGGNAGGGASLVGGNWREQFGEAVSQNPLFSGFDDEPMEYGEEEYLPIALGLGAVGLVAFTGVLRRTTPSKRGKGTRKSSSRNRGVRL